MNYSKCFGNTMIGIYLSTYSEYFFTSIQNTVKNHFTESLNIPLIPSMISNNYLDFILNIMLTMRISVNHLYGT